MRKFYFCTLSVFASMLLLPSQAFAVNIVNSNITSNTTWSATTSSSTYVVTANVAVNPGVTLTINPGVVVKFQSGRILTVNGALKAQGVSTSSIYLTSYNDDAVDGDTNGDGTATAGAAGQWGYIVVSAGGTTTLTNTSIRYGGATFGMIRNNGGSLTLTNATVSTSSLSLPAINHVSGTTTVANSTILSNQYGISLDSTATGGLTVSSSTITKSSAYGIYVRGTPTLSLTQNNFATNTTGAVYVDYGAGIGGGPITFNHTQNRAWGNGINGFNLTGVTILSNKTLMGDTMPYLLSSNLVVNSGTTLTIATSSVIKFLDTTKVVTVNGTLSVEGSAAAPVYFTSYKDDYLTDTNNNGSATSPVRGDWGGFYVPTGGTATLNYANIRYGGNVNGATIYTTGGTLNLNNSEVASSSTSGIQTFSGISIISTSTIYANASYGINHSGGTTTIATSTIRDHSTYGFNAVSSAGGLIVNNNIFSRNVRGGGLVNLADNLNFIHSNNSATGSGMGGVYIYGSAGKAQTWYADPLFPYIASSTVGEILLNVHTVTVNPGAVFKFEGANTRFRVNSGKLIADSSASTSKIYFTSIKDDSVGGDTNGNGSANSPAAGDWDELSALISSSVLTLNNAVVRYGGNAVTGGGKMIWNNGGTINLNNVEVASSSAHGVHSTSGTTNATSTTIHHNVYGYTHGGGTSNIANKGNTIFSNSNLGIQNTTGVLINAEQIYWPATTTGATMNGPYSTSTNPSGRGDAVIPTFIDFDPWVTTITTGNITTNTTWTASSTYVIDGTLTIDAGKTLTIPAATVIKFKTTNSGIVVNGTLNANGILESKIYLTSYKDDRRPLIGDTNGDGTATIAQSNDWDMIKVNSGGIANLTHAILRYGGNTTSKMLYGNGGTINLDNSEVAYSNTGIYTVPGSALTLASTTIAHNVYGLYHDGGSTTFNLGNIIENNTTYGIFNGTTATITAAYVYWPSTTTPATSTGPYHPTQNPTGNGDAISNFVAWNTPVAMLHFMSEAQTAVSSTTNQIRWQWISTSTQTYGAQLTSAIATWNSTSTAGMGVINIVSTSTNVTLKAQEVNSTLYDWSGQYSIDTFPPLIQINNAKLFDNTLAEIQNTWTHELGHALGLHHSYIDNTMYYINSPQTTLGTQDKLDYSYCWPNGMGNCIRY